VAARRASRFLPTAVSRQQESTYSTIAKNIENILARPELANFIRTLERHNCAANANRNRSPFLLSPYLFHIFHSVEARTNFLATISALNRPAWKVRAHFRESSEKAKKLARLIRKGPQPTVILAPAKIRAAAALFQVFSSISSSSKSASPAPLDRVLDDAAISFELAAKKITRAKQNRPRSSGARIAQKELRSRAVLVLLPAFRERFSRPYFNIVAIMAELISSIETDAEYVKKIEQQQLGRPVRG
jgi:hypothetical protein